MVTMEMRSFNGYSASKVFRLTLTNEAFIHFSASDIKEFDHLTALILENNSALHHLDLSGCKQLEYLCVGSCDQLETINLEHTNISTIDIYDLVNIKRIDLDTSQYFRLEEILTDNITKQFFYIEQCILQSFNERINAESESTLKRELTLALENYIETM